MNFHEFIAYQSAGLDDLGTVTLPGHASNITDLADVIMVVINWALGIAGAFAVFAIIYSGLMYITASGDIAKSGSNPEKVTKAKKNLVWAIIGVVVILLSYIIVQWVAKIVTTGQS